MTPPTESQPAAAKVAEIGLTMSGDAGSRFLPILGEGIFIKGPSGQTVESFLVETVGIPLVYLKERVQTVFLDGRALDDFSTARVTDAATLALSAAMPGLAGAVLRRGGIYAPMRRQISYTTQPQNDGNGGDVLVTLKLFNMVARELGPEFLKKGVCLSGVQLQDFLKRLGHWAWKGCLSVDVDGKSATADQLIELLADRRWVRLSVHTPG
jgi:hypothetical protein